MCFEHLSAVFEAECVSDTITSLIWIVLKPEFLWQQRRCKCVCLCMCVGESVRFLKGRGLHQSKWNVQPWESALRRVSSLRSPTATFKSEYPCKKIWTHLHLFSWRSADLTYYSLHTFFFPILIKMPTESMNFNSWSHFTNNFVCKFHCWLQGCK